MLSRAEAQAMAPDGCELAVNFAAVTRRTLALEFQEAFARHITMSYEDPAVRPVREFLECLTILLDRSHSSND